MAQYRLVRKNRQLQTPDPCNCYQNDHVDLVVEGAGIRLCRLSSLSVPAEVSAYIPRVEIRQRRYENGQLTCEDERIYNSITVVHAPRHPLEHPSEIPFIDTTPISTGNSTNIPSGPVPGKQPTLAPPKSGEPAPPEPGVQPPPPKVPTAPGPNQPGAAAPPVIPSQPEPHPPPVSPRESSQENGFNLPTRPIRRVEPSQPPVIKINKRRID